MCYILQHLLAILLLCLCSTFSLQDTEYSISFLSITVFRDMRSYSPARQPNASTDAASSKRYIAQYSQTYDIVLLGIPCYSFSTVVQWNFFSVFKIAEQRSARRM